jgi:ferrous iron transport protein B
VSRQRRKRQRGQKKRTFALVGNQNCGKTTLFNQLTGSNQHVGNWPGVTVEKKEGVVKKMPHITVVDLPGIYSLSPYTMEEVISRNYILDEHPDAVINIVDATNLERNLYLSLQIAELGVPMVIALNMMDEVEAAGDVIDVEALQNKLGIPVVPISAVKNMGVEDLLNRAIYIAEHKQLPVSNDICGGEVHKALHAIAHLVEDKARKRGYSPRFAATKLIEGDKPVQEELCLDEQDIHIIDDIIKHMEEHTGMDRESVLPDTRYNYITSIVNRHVQHKHSKDAPTRSQKIDRVLTNRFFAIPAFILMMLLVFFITFGPIGSFVAEWFGVMVDAGIEWIGKLLFAAGVSEGVYGLIVDGILIGVGTVINFMPPIIIMFMCLSILEDSGYMSRAAFVMDAPLRKIGLNGRSFIPLIMGFGCTVPAIMGTRVLQSRRDRNMTMILTPFMSCGAKVPVYALFTAAFFKENQVLVMMSLYVLGIVVAILAALILKKTIYKASASGFVMELPPYRMPSFKTVMIHMWEKAKEFVKRAFTIILIASIVIWLLSSFDSSFQYIGSASQSMNSILASIGNFIAPLFEPLGFGNYQAVTSLIAGMMAKENIISTMAILYGSSASELPNVLQGAFTPMSAYSFLVFILLYTPCIAAVTTMSKELKSPKASFLVVCAQIAIAWLAAFIIYQNGLLLGF